MHQSSRATVRSPASIVLAWLTMLVVGTLPAEAHEPGGFHALRTGVVCNGAEPFEQIDCRAPVRYFDSFGDSLQLDQAFAIVESAGGDVRLPPSGNLEIIDVIGNTTATVGGSLPILIGEAGSFLSGLPGLAEDGEVVFGVTGYVVQLDDPSPLVVRYTLDWQDLCDQPSTPPDCPAGAQFSESEFAAIEIFRFDPSSDTSFVGPLPTGVTSADFEPDADIDVACVAFDDANPDDPGVLVLFLNDGSGDSFTRPPPAETGRMPTDLVVADFDGVDGPDVAVTNGLDDSVTVFLNDGLGAGTFQPARTIPGVGAFPAAIAAGRLDDDGDVDLAVANALDGTIQILDNDGNGDFTLGLVIDLGSEPGDMAAADFDLADGDDLVVTLRNDAAVVVLLNSGAGAFVATPPVPVEERPGRVDPSCVDNDKFVDVVVLNEASGSVSIVLNDLDAGGGFCAVPPTGVGADPRSLATVDIDLDGLTELLLISGADAQRTVRLLDNLGCACPPEDPGCARCDRLCQFVSRDLTEPDPALELVDAARLTGDDNPDVIAVVRGAPGLTGGVDSAVQVSTNGRCSPDVNRNGDIDTHDLVLLLRDWGLTCECRADVNSDEVVNQQDLNLILSMWGPTANCN